MYLTHEPMITYYSSTSFGEKRSFRALHPFKLLSDGTLEFFFSDGSEVSRDLIAWIRLIVIIEL